MAQAIESFRLKLVLREFPPPLLKCERDRMWEQASLFDEVNDG
jgi:hypothetical protein